VVERVEGGCMVRRRGGQQRMKAWRRKRQRTVLAQHNRFCCRSAVIQVALQSSVCLLDTCVGVRGALHTSTLLTLRACLNAKTKGVLIGGVCKYVMCVNVGVLSLTHPRY